MATKTAWSLLHVKYLLSLRQPSWEPTETQNSHHKTALNQNIFIIFKKKYSETSLIRTLIGLENCVLNRGVSLLEGFILIEIKALVIESAGVIRGVSANGGFSVL